MLTLICPDASCYSLPGIAAVTAPVMRAAALVGAQLFFLHIILTPSSISSCWSCACNIFTVPYWGAETSRPIRNFNPSGSIRNFRVIQITKVSRNAQHPKQRA